MCPAGGSDPSSSVQDLAVQYESIDLGAIYRVSAATRLGLMVKNIVGFSFKEEYRGFATPRYATLALAHTMGPTTLSLDSEYVFGRFGGHAKQSANIWFLRGGIEYGLSRWVYLRAGLVYPVLAETSASGNLKSELPWPGVGGSLGLGLTLDRFDIDLALYGDPARSYVEESLNLGATGSLTFKFW
jgi:hypothetical protein